MSALTYGYLLPTQEAIGQHGSRIHDLIDLGVEAERSGFDTVWLPDSPFQYGLPDPLLVIASLAARTSRVTLAPGVLVAALRTAPLLAQQLATLDVLTAGRLQAGFGLGFRSAESERQFSNAGVPFASRAARLEESIALLRELWSTPGQPVTREGTHVTVRELVLSPAPTRSGGPPIWLAGAGPRAERRVGRLADGWLPYFPDPRDYAEGWHRVQEAAVAEGRAGPPVPGLYLTISLDDSVPLAQERLRKTVESWYGRPFNVTASLQAMYAGTLEGLGDHLQPYVDAGLRHVVLRVADQPKPGLEAAAGALEQLRSAKA